MSDRVTVPREDLIAIIDRAYAGVPLTDLGPDELEILARLLGAQHDDEAVLDATPDEMEQAYDELDTAVKQIIDAIDPSAPEFPGLHEMVAWVRGRMSAHASELVKEQALTAAVLHSVSAETKEIPTPEETHDLARWVRERTIRPYLTGDGLEDAVIRVVAKAWQDHLPGREGEPYRVWIKGSGVGGYQIMANDSLGREAPISTLPFASLEAAQEALPREVAYRLLLAAHGAMSGREILRAERRAAREPRPRPSGGLLDALTAGAEQRRGAVPITVTRPKEPAMSDTVQLLIYGHSDDLVEADGAGCVFVDEPDDAASAEYAADSTSESVGLMVSTPDGRRCRLKFTYTVAGVWAVLYAPASDGEEAPPGRVEVSGYTARLILDVPVGTIVERVDP